MKKSIPKWLLENLSSNPMSLEELEKLSNNQWSFGELMTNLNKLLVDKKIRCEGEEPLRWYIAV